MLKQTLMEIKKGQVGTGLLLENDGYVSLDLEQNRQLRESIAIDDKGNRMLPDPFIVSTVFQKYGIENANGRIYPEAVLKREVEKYQEAIKERRAYGELNHPETSVIDAGRICMNVVELHWEGHTLVGKMEIPISDGFRRFGIVSTLADMVAQWIISGLKIGVSSRGLGSVTKQYGRLVVGDDFELVCFDVVTQPSTPGAWISEDPIEIKQYVENVKTDKPIVNEGAFDKFKDWLQN
jgi:hypothetical protein